MKFKNIRDHFLCIRSLIAGRKGLKKLYNEKKRLLKEELASIDYVSIATDLWRCGRKRHYICITAHFITATFTQRNTILSFRQFYGRSFAIRLRRHIRTVLAMYGLDKGKLQATTTENGADMRKATQMTDVFGVRLHCAAHGLNLVVQKSLNLWPKSKRKTTELPCASASITKALDDDEDSGDEDVSDGGSSTDTHSDHSIADTESESENADVTVDLDCDDDSSESNEDEAILLDIQDIGILMAKSRKLINIIRKSSIPNGAIRNLARDSTTVELILDMKVRWNSSFQMIQRLLLHQQVLATFCDNLDSLDGVTLKQRKKLSEVKLSSVDWNILSAMRRVLERFNDATEILSGKSYPTLSLAYPVIYSLYNYLHDRSGDGTENGLKDALIEKFTDYVLPPANTKHADLLFSAAFLDSLVHDMLPVEHRAKAEKFLQSAVKRYQKNNTITRSVSPSSSVSSTTASSNLQSKSTAMLKKFLTKCGVNSNADAGDLRRSLTIQQELARMVSLSKDNQDFSLFWQQHHSTMPLLAVQASKYLAISATSVPSESAFSISSYVLRKNRLSLTSKNLKYSMFLKDKLVL